MNRTKTLLVLAVAALIARPALAAPTSMPAPELEPVAPSATPLPPPALAPHAAAEEDGESDEATAAADGQDDEQIEAEIRAESEELQELRRAEGAAKLLDRGAPGDGAAEAADHLGYESPLRQRLHDAFRREVGGGREGAQAIPGLPEIDHDLARLQAEYDIPIDVNDAVIAYVRFFQSPRVRPHFVRWLSRSHRYIPRYREIMKEEGLPEDTVYLAMIESGFANLATSRAKAVGPWQFIPATGRRMGLDQDFWVDERRDPEKAARAAAKFLKSLHDDFGDWRLAWAGYNAGPGKIRSAFRKGYSDFWDMAAGRKVLHPETKGYVPKLMAAAIVAKHPEAFGFGRDEIVPEQWTEYEEVLVPRATALSAIAEAAAVPEKALLDLNPELRRLVTPPRQYAVKIPKGQSEQFAAAWPAISERASRLSTHHTVQRGETIAAIASAYGVAPKTLAKLNGVRAHRRPRAGMVLTVPLGALARAQADRTALAMKDPVEEPRSRSKKAVAGKSKGSSGKAVLASASASKRSAASGETVRVRAGDTLWSIARKFGVGVNDLARWNGIRSPSKHNLKAGHTLVVRPKVGAATSSVRGRAG